MSGAGPLGWDVGAAAFVAGVASFFSPCVAPLVPGYMSYLAATSARRSDDAEATGQETSGRTALTICLLFVGGFSATFVALGLLAASFGSLLVAYRPVLETVAGIAMLVMGAFLLNLLPRQWIQTLSREWRLPTQARALGGLAPFGLGVVFAAGWTPCIGPVLGSILLYASASANAGKGMLLLALYTLGFALPFLGVGLGWSGGLRAVGWLKRHGNIVTMVSGVALILVGLIYLTGQVAQISIWAQQLAPGRG
jgi:cytochrome c-type biogenesis protein